MQQGADRGFLAVKNFAAFQHYKDRGPVWIKLYTRLLEDYDFLALSDAARSQLMLIWLVASRTHNRIPDDARWISHAIHASGPVKLAELKRAGFLLPAPPIAEDVEQNASTVLAESYQDATAPRARGEGEEMREETTPRPLWSVGRIRSEIPERYHADLDRMLKYVNVPETLYATLDALNSGAITPPAFSWEEIGLGVHDLVANGKHLQFNARQLRRYVQGAREQLTADPNGAPLGRDRKLTIGEKVFAKASGRLT